MLEQGLAKPLSNRQSFSCQGQNWSYNFKFIDDAPTANVSHTYKIQMMSDDFTAVKQVLMRGLLLKR